VVFEINKKIICGVLLTMAFNFSGCGIFGELKTIFSAPQKISGKVKIDGNWIEIIPPEPLPSTAGKHLVAVTTVAVRGYDETDKTGQTLKFEDGESGQVEAILFDDRGNEYQLGVVAVGGKAGGFYLGKIHDSGKRQADEPDFPHERTYNKLKIRSDVAFAAEKIEWTAEVQK
jgi:hypothetical protein